MAATQGQLRSVDAYLERMGVRDPQLRARVEGGLPWAQPDDVAAVGAGAESLDGDTSPWRPLNAAAVALLDAAADAGQVLLVHLDHALYSADVSICQAFRTCTRWSTSHRARVHHLISLSLTVQQTLVRW